jgi:hypothetical protein
MRRDISAKRMCCSQACDGHTPRLNCPASRNLLKVHRMFTK